jgi:hypothetical protein
MLELCPYYRRDRQSGISPPDLSKTCTFAEHIVRARGKRTQYTSVSTDPTKIKDFGDALYRVNRSKTSDDGHSLIEHESLVCGLREAIAGSSKAERQQAIQALRYARRRHEGLVRWNFDISSVEKKELVIWAERKIQDYFLKVR